MFGNALPPAAPAVSTTESPSIQPDMDPFMDSTNTIEYKLRDLTTRSVTLFPTRAQVFREIKNVPLQVSSPPIPVALD
jgi:hypothetical protein